MQYHLKSLFFATVKYEKFVPSGRTDSEIGGNLDAGIINNGWGICLDWSKFKASILSSSTGRSWKT